MSNYHFVSECPGTANKGLTFALYKMELTGTYKPFRLAMPHIIDVFRNLEIYITNANNNSVIKVRFPLREGIPVMLRIARCITLAAMTQVTATKHH